MTKAEEGMLTRKIQRDLFDDAATVEGPLFETEDAPGGDADESSNLRQGEHGE